eukprot:2279598-Amphidinium_carterae.1
MGPPVYCSHTGPAQRLSLWGSFWELAIRKGDTLLKKGLAQIHGSPFKHSKLSVALSKLDIVVTSTCAAACLFATTQQYSKCATVRNQVTSAPCQTT